MTNHTENPTANPNQQTLTTDDLAIIERDVAAVGAAGDRFAISFYEAVFTIAPQARAMFPDDLSAQRRKLMSELSTLVGFALDLTGDGTERFTKRAEALGRRHVGYGVVEAHYAIVGEALIGTLAAYVPDWADSHQRAWTRLYTAVATTMQRATTNA